MCIPIHGGSLSMPQLNSTQAVSMGAVPDRHTVATPFALSATTEVTNAENEADVIPEHGISPEHLAPVPVCSSAAPNLPSVRPIIGTPSHCDLAANTYDASKTQELSHVPANEVEMADHHPPNQT